MRSKFYFVKEWNGYENGFDYNVYAEGEALDEDIVHDDFLCACVTEEDALRICKGLELELRERSGWRFTMPTT